jgi:hypothetical protein
MRLAAIAACMVVSGACSAADLWLAPGKSVTIFDAADASVRLVITAPADAPLDLGALLELKPDESVHSIATRLQLRGSSAMTRGTDGGLALSGPAGAAHGVGPMLESGVLVRDAGKWTYHRTEPAVAAQTAHAPPAGSQKTLISKPGATLEQAQRDIAQCRVYAERSAAQFLRSQEKSSAYNSAMHACLRSFGYTLQMSSAVSAYTLAALIMSSTEKHTLPPPAPAPQP